jgi:hypothetical protein
MAKHVIIESYTFNPTTKTIVVVGKNIRKEQLLLITNVTQNVAYQGTVLYNFSDPALGATSYVTAVDANSGTETTTIVLSYNTAAMSATDKLSILVEETYTELIPAEIMRDPVDKLRVSTPQSLIDTDFEYGQQPTKWESITLLNNRPSASYDSTQPAVLSNITASGNVVTATLQAFSGSITSAAIVSTITGIASTANLYPGAILVKQSGTGTFGTGTTTVLSVDSATQITVQSGSAMTAGAFVFTTQLPSVGQPLFMQGSLDAANADGWWLCTASTVASGTFTFSTIVNPAVTPLVDPTKSYIWLGNFYTGAAIPAGTTAIVTNGTRATVTTTFGHGLRIGDTVYIVGSTTNAALNNTWVVETTPTTNTFTFLTAAAATTHTTPLNACIHPRSMGYVQHRPFDGGVQFSNVSPYHGYQVIRQTRRQFRYQSGKGIQFSTGSILKPALFVENLTNGGSGSTITVTCKYPHGLLPGSIVKVAGSTDAAYNGNFAVVTVSGLTFTYTSTARIDAAGSIPATAPAPGFPITVSPFTWYGSYNRIGMFDNQNGFFFEYDGQTLSCVKRSSTTQISGAIAVNAGSNAVTGTSTKFSQQLKPGDYVVIRGMSYTVQQITTDTAMTIYPEYRGATNISGAVVSKTIDTKYPQSQWNIDKLDGTGASLFNMDLTKMQMFYIDFTWYGAGAIRFGVKNNRGEVIYCHRIANNNLNTEAYMRTGNLVARYETNTHTPYTYLASTLASGFTTSMTVADASNFPPAGIVVLSQASDTAGVIEYVNYTSKTGNVLNNLTRNVQNIAIVGAGSAAGGSATATAFTVTGQTTGSLAGTAPIKVELYGPSQASTISHWGSAVMMDGRYDDDKSLVFVGGLNRTQTITNVGQDVTVPLVSIRIAPTVDNGLTGVLGSRELINRMQLIMRSLSTVATGTGIAFLISLRLNGRVSAGQFAQVGGSSLAQLAIHPASTTITGGETVFGFYTSGGVNTEDLNQVRDLGTNILGGGTTNSCPNSFLNLYPDGPDIITICATNVTTVTTNSILARISWTEAQA